MENEQNQEQNKDPKEQARNLYFLSGLTQAQIAELVGVSQKTISLWMNEGKWRHLRETAEKAPSILIEQMIEEVVELHKNIASREPGKRFATLQEAEIRRKTMASIKTIREQQTKGAHAEVMINFMSYLRRRDLHGARNIVMHADEYMKGSVMLDSDLFIPYDLPGDTGGPGTDDMPPAGGNNNPIKPSPSNGTGESGPLNKAA